MDNVNKVLFVNPAKKKSAYGFDRHVYTMKTSTGEVVTTVGMQKSKGFNTHGSAAESFMFPIDYRSMKVVTGLDELMVNPFKGLTVTELKSSYRLPSSWTVERIEEILSVDKITEQRYYEIKHEVAYDFYTSEIQGRTLFDTKVGADMTHAVKNSKPSYLQKFRFTFHDRPNRIEGGTQRNDMALKLVKVHPSIASNSSAVNPAQHRFFVSEEEEELMKTLQKDKLVNEGIYKLYTLLTKSSEYSIYRVASLLKEKRMPLVKGEVSKDALVGRLNKYIHSAGKNKMKHINNFIDVYDMFNNKATKDLFEMTYLLQQAMNEDVISTVDGYFIWHSQYDQPNLYKLGTNKAKVIQFFIRSKKKFDAAKGDTEVTNEYSTLLEELKARQVRVK